MTRWILNNRHIIWALTIAVAIFGVIAYKQLPVQLFPDTAPPLVNVMTAYPGAAAEDIAERLTRRLEEEFAALEGVVKVKSSSQDNLSMVSVEFVYDRDPDLAAIDTQNAIARIRGDLPAGIREPQVLKFSTADRPIITFGVAAPELTGARKLAEDTIAPRLQRIPGVAAVDVFGGSKPSIEVELDRRKLEAARIPMSRVVESLRAHNASSPAAMIRSESTQTIFRVDTRADSIGDLARIPIATYGGSHLLLGDLASIRNAAAEDDSRFRLNGKQVIAMQVYKTSEANTVDVVRRAQASIAELEGVYEGVEFVAGEESATFAQTSVDNLIGNIWQAILFTAILIFFFLRQWRTSLLVALSMPLAFGMTFVLMKVLSIELNLVTLSAIILAVGIVIDNSVVMLENITRRREEEGLSPPDAAIAGADEIRGALLGGTTTNLAVLVPLLFLSGFVGKTFGPLALTLLLTFISSLAVALVLVPLFSVYAGGGGRIDRVAYIVSMPFAWLMEKIKRFYLSILKTSLRFRPATILLALLMVGAGVAGIRSLGMSVLPLMDSGSFFVSLETSTGSSLEHTERVVMEVEQLLAAEEEVKLIQSQVGFEQGMRSFSSFGVQGPTQGFITVMLSDRNQREESVWQIEARVRERLARIPGIRAATVRELGNTAKATTSAPIVVRISGPDPQILDLFGERVLQQIAGVESVVSPMRSWRIDQRQGRVDVDELKALQHGFTPMMVGQLLLAGSNGVPAGDYYGTPGTPIPVKVSYQPGDRQTPAELLRFPLFSPSSPTPVALAEIATVRDVVGQGLVTRQHLIPDLEVSAFIEGRALSFVLADIEHALADMPVPSGYAVTLSGEKDDLGEAKSEIGLALAIGIVGVYLLLVAQFRSFLHPLTVLMSVPLSLAGIAAALTLTGKPMSMPVMIGLILIVGTVINSAILLLSFIEQQRARGVELNEAIHNAVALRFRPIMITAISTIIGMVPLAAEWSLGAERFSPLAIAVIGGFATSTLLTIIVIPVLYSLFDGLSRRARALRR